MGNIESAPKNVKETIRENDKNKQVKIVCSWIAKKSLFSWFGPNHWSVILQLDNGQYACIQKHNYSFVVSLVRNSLESAALETWGETGRRVRLSCYGEVDNITWSSFFERFVYDQRYFLLFDDCQNFSRITCCYAQTCSTNASWREPVASASVPVSPAILTQNPAYSIYGTSDTQWRVMCDWNYDQTTLTVATGLSNGLSVAGALKLTTSVWGPRYVFLASRQSTTIAYRAGRQYQVDFSFLLGETQAQYNTITNISVIIAKKIDVNGWPNGWLSEDFIVARIKGTTYGSWSSTNAWVTKQILFTPSIDIAESTLFIQIYFNELSGPTPRKYYFRDLRLTVPSYAITTPANLLTQDSESIVLPRPPQSLDPQDISKCPYLQTGLKHWHDPATWGAAGVPSPNTNITLPANTKVLVSSCSMSSTQVYQKIVVPATSELIFMDANMTINFRDIYVQGKLIMGTTQCRYNARINLIFSGAKTLQDNIAPFLGTKGIGVAQNAFISMHGKQYHNTWTKLATTAYTGDRVVYLLDNVNWEVGQQVFITTSYMLDDPSYNLNEILTIEAIQGKRVQFTQPVQYLHYGGQEYQSEIGLLSRRIKLSGSQADSTEANGFGGQLIIVGEGQVAGVEFERFGQKNLKARYPVHFHLANTVKNSYISDCSVHDSFYRCITIHGTNNLTVTRNTAFNAYGHCYYLEDGVEENNTISYNLGAYIKTIGTPAAGTTQQGEWFYESDDLKQPADVAASPFYITNCYNRFIGNAASGGWAGFSFPNLYKPIGNHKTVNIVPASRPFLEFNGNSGHSSGFYFNFGGTFYVGGNLSHSLVDGTLIYNSGRTSRQTLTSSGNIAFLTFTNTKVFLSHMGVAHWGDTVEVIGLESHDSSRPATLFGQAWLHNAIVNGQTQNALSRLDTYTRQGFQFYDTLVQTVLSNIQFRNFIHNPNAPNPEEDNSAIVGITFSDVYKPQGISATKNISYVNVPDSQIVGLNVIPTGASRFFNFMDWDGSATKRGVPTLLGSTPNWWNFHSSCSFQNNWKTWLCNKVPGYEIASLFFRVPGFIEWNESYPGWPLTPIGNFSLFGNGITDRRTIPFTQNPGMTGMSNFGWYMYTFRGSPTFIEFHLLQIPFNNHIIMAIPYPAGTTFSIVAYYYEESRTFTPVSSLATLRAGSGQNFYFDGVNLYIKFVDLAATGSSDEYFERNGVRVYGVNWGLYVHIHANCAGAVNDVCPVTPDILPYMV
ncbi:hypothetical protein PPL_00585 [Heterostelium album PN500]|uniref:G8 domain-containing protein n=1 Tax=Heterostelium pallidum (strain ATCC 26659 / Pp 5 / PN500) TaxID=670386 RepID=D3AWV7_HETP5|nr:hypothetical protein PPL_00585 [Heterostelium album PN500]EFA86780.1 hypothetical protein PPL_00585 [Heterostelium album PN500]|eukprot:XP_020438884.1 hypothetical protein PPL_00585 [Heterostelium album PN500]